MKLKYYMRGLGIGIAVTALIMGLSSGAKSEMTNAEIMARAEQLGMVSGNRVLLSSQAEADGAGAAENAEEVVSENESGVSENAGADASKGDVSEDADSVSSNAGSAENADNTGAEQGTEDADKDIVMLPNEKIVNVQLEKEDAAGVAQTEHNYTALEPEETDDVADADQATGTATKPDAKSVQITVASGNGSDTVSVKLADAGLVDDAAKFDKYLCDHNYDNKITVGKHTVPAGATYEEVAKIITSAAE